MTAPADDPIFAGFRGDLTLGPSHKSSTWKDSFTSLIGIFSPKEFSKYRFGSPFPEFTQTGVMVFPFEQAPKRIASFVLASRTLTEEATIKAIPVFRKEGIQDAGLWGIETTMTPTPIRKFRDVVFAVENPILGLKLQQRHTRTAKTFLPIVSWYDDCEALRTQESWSLCRNKTLIFVTPEITANVLFHAIKNEGLIWANFNNDKGASRKFSQMFDEGTVVDQLHRAITNALPWPEAVKRWLNVAKFQKVQLVLQELRTRFGYDPADMLDVVDSDFLKNITTIPSRREVTVDKRTVVAETAKGWIIKRSNETCLLSEARFTITRIEYLEDEVFYSGRIFLRDKSVSYRVPAGELEKSAKTFLVRQCLLAGIGRPRFGIGQPEFDLIDVALQFHTPVNLKGVL